MSVNYFDNYISNSYDAKIHETTTKWIAINQFIYELPQDFSYAISISRNSSHEHRIDSRLRINIGSMNWQGTGVGKSEVNCISNALKFSKRRSALTFSSIMRTFRKKVISVLY